MGKPRKPMNAGEQHGRLTVLGPSDERRGKRRLYCVVAKCSCGKVGIYEEDKLRTGNTKSCGCLVLETSLRNLPKGTHGMKNTKIWRIWSGMRQRCGNPNFRDFHNYGGRGIRVCERWQNSFEAFFADMGEPPASRLSIDRIDVNGNYEPGNCRWATTKVQGMNRRNTRYVEVAGKRLCVSDASKVLGLSEAAIWAKVQRSGCTYQEAADYFAFEADFKTTRNRTPQER